MSLLVFAVGVVVFLITVYGTVSVGGLLLTGRQLDEHPQLDPLPSDRDLAVDAKRPLVPADY